MGQESSKKKSETQPPALEEEKKSKNVVDPKKTEQLPTTGPYIGYALTEKKFLYLYHLPTKTSYKLFMDLEKQHGCDDLIVGSFYFLIGGYDSFNAVYSVALNSDLEVTRRADLNIGRFYSNSTTIDNSQIYTIGGRMIDQSLTACEKYSLAKNRWTLLKPLNIPRECVTLGTMNSRYVYAIEGRNQSGFISSVERFDSFEEEAGWTFFVIKQEERFVMGGCWCVQKNDSDLLIAGGTRVFMDGSGIDEVWTMNGYNGEMRKYEEKLPRGAEMYSPAVLYKHCYYQFTYCYERPKFDLIQYNTVTGKFGLTESKMIWRKLSL